MDNLANWGSFQPNGTDRSVQMAQEELKNTMNKGAVKQMEVMANQANSQLLQTQINSRRDLMNAARDSTGQVRL